MRFSLTFKNLSAAQMARILLTAEEYEVPAPDIAMYEPGLTVQLVDAGGNKIQVIKAIREMVGLGLKEAKDLIEQTTLPRIVASKLSRDNAEAMAARLTEAGATVAVVEP
jgi:large subunit ribosomal protein L7/L12